MLLWFSTRNPQFDQDSLRRALENVGMTYHWAGPQLGGFWEARSDSPKVALEGGGYADYTVSEAFEWAVVQPGGLGMRGSTCSISIRAGSLAASSTTRV